MRPFSLRPLALVIIISAAASAGGNGDPVTYPIGYTDRVTASLAFVLVDQDYIDFVLGPSQCIVQLTHLLTTIRPKTRMSSPTTTATVSTTAMDRPVTQ